MMLLLLKKIRFGKIYIALWLLTTISAPVYNQFYNTGSAPFSVRWRQINTQSFNVIFPNENENTASYLASYLTQTISLNNDWYDSIKSKPVNIILYNQNVLSNGYVTLAPKRMELITVPNQDSYSQPWIEQLAIHEYRHVIQLHTLNQGFTKGLSFLLGEIVPGGVSGFLPLWYLEGDAVVAETALSYTGRGREPGFSKEIKAIELQQEKRFSYDQAYLGSYKYYTPDHYKYGYQMVAYAYSNFGTNAFNQTLKTVAKRPFIIAPFYYGLKRNTGLSKTQLYDSTFSYLSNLWKNELPSTFKDAKSELVKTQFESKYTSYKFPYIDNHYTIFALRTSIDDIARLVAIIDGTENEIFTIGNFLGNQIGYSERYIAWEELQHSLRWEQKNYSVIRIYDRKSRQTSVLRKKIRHFSPSLNQKGSKLAVIRIDSSNIAHAEIYKTTDKKLISHFSHPENEQLSYNCWINDSLLAFVTLGKKGKSIYTLNIHSGKWVRLFGPVFYNISSLTAYQNNLFFTYTLDGKQNIYQYNVNKNIIKRITDVKIAADYASFTNNKLIYSDYCMNGYKLKLLIAKNFENVTDEEIIPYNHDFAAHLSKLAKRPETEKYHVDTAYPVKKYSRIINLFNFHSRIIPVYIDVINSSNISDALDLYNNTYLGINFFSQNMLSTVTSSLGYYYKDGYHHFRPILYFTGIYPKISVDMDIGGDIFVLSENDSLVSKPSGHQQNKEISLRIDFPFNFSTSRYTMYLHAGLSLNYNNIYIASASKSYDYNLVDSLSGTYFYNGLTRINYSLNYYALSKMSKKDLYPKWGINIYLSSLNTLHTIPYKYLWESNVFIGTAYLPGFFRHHSIRLKFSLEDGLADRINRRNLPRGFQVFDYNISNLTRKYSLDYILPLMYPDLSIGPLAYIKRIQSNLFYDYMQFQASDNLGSNANKTSGYLYSYGAEIGIETHFLRFFIPFTPTLQYSYMPQKGNYSFSFFMNSSFRF